MKNRGQRITLILRNTCGAVKQTTAQKKIFFLSPEKKPNHLLGLISSTVIKRNSWALSAGWDCQNSPVESKIVLGFRHGRLEMADDFIEPG